MELALDIRPSQKHIDQISKRRFTEAVVHLFLQHLTKQTKAKVFFRKAITKKEDIAGVFTVSDTERGYFDSIIVPFRSDSWWYVAVNRDIRHEKWIVILLSSKAPKPPDWPAKTDFLELPDAVHDQLDSNFLAFPCLQALCVDLPRFFDALQRRQMCCSTDVPAAVAEVKDIVEAAVSRRKKASVKHDAVAGLGMLTRLSFFSFPV